MLLDRLTVDQGAVGAVEVFEEGIVEDGDDGGVLARDRQIVDLDVVERPAPDGEPLLVERNFLEHQPVHRKDQSCHLAFLPSLSYPKRDS
jgi:hypothetical protein